MGADIIIGVEVAKRGTTYSQVNSVVDWNRELSPWPAKAVFGDEDFSGGADDFIEKLVENIIPKVENRLNITKCKLRR